MAKKKMVYVYEAVWVLPKTHALLKKHKKAVGRPLTEIQHAVFSSLSSEQIKSLFK